MRPQLLPEPLGEWLISRGDFFSPAGWRWLILGRVWPVAGTFSGTFDSHVVAECYLPSDPIHPRASSMSVRDRTTRTPSPERKSLMLCVTGSRAPAPIAAARIGTSFGSASSHAR